MFGEDDLKHIASYTSQDYLRATSVISAYQYWVENRVNDQYENNTGDHTCDIILYEQLNFNIQNRVEQKNLLCNEQETFPILDDDIPWMTTHIKGKTKGDKQPGQKKFRKKCIKFQHRFSDLAKVQASPPDLKIPKILLLNLLAVQKFKSLSPPILQLVLCTS